MFSYLFVVVGVAVVIVSHSRLFLRRSQPPYLCLCQRGH